MKNQDQEQQSDRMDPVRFICQVLWHLRWFYALWAYWLAVEIYHYWH